MQPENDGPVTPQTGPRPVFAEPLASGDFPMAGEPAQVEPVQAEPVQAEPAQAEAAASVPPAEDVPVASEQAWQQPVQQQPPAPQQQAEPEFGGLDDGPGVAGYAGVDMSGPQGPVKAGIPSSGNWQMPEWMREETEANQAVSAQSGGGLDEGEMRRDRSRTMMFAGLGVLVLALIAVLGVVVLKPSDDGPAAPEAKVAPSSEEPAPVDRASDAALPKDKALTRFKGTGSRIAGVVADPLSKLSYPKFGAPWVLPTKKNKLGQSGWSGQQIMVTEKSGTQLWYATVLSAPLGPVERRAVRQGDLRATAAGVFTSLENRLYGFPHTVSPVASQELTVDGHKGWLVANYLKYKRIGIKATGEVIVTVVVDTGAKVPSLLFISMPNTHKKLWPDINTVLAQLKVA